MPITGNPFSRSQPMEFVAWQWSYEISTASSENHTSSAVMIQMLAAAAAEQHRTEKGLTRFIDSPTMGAGGILGYFANY